MSENGDEAAAAAAAREGDSPQPEQEEEEEEVARTEDFQKLVDHGIDEKVAAELDDIYKAGILAHSDLDQRALDALKEFHAEGGIAVLNEFRESNLEHVSNKSAYLCGVMKTYRQKHKTGAEAVAGLKKPGPDETKLKEILERSGYSLDVTTGQRKYGGPPPGEQTTQPGAGHEVFCGKIPKEIFEDELVPLFEKCGTIWDLRLMMDPMTGLNRGYCFVTYCEKSGAQEAVKQLDGYDIKPGKKLKVNISVANLRLFVGNIPKSKSREEIEEEFSNLTDGLSDVIIYSSPDDPKKRNRGFAFLEYDSHKTASVAKRRIGNGRTRVWGCDIIVDWADPQEEPDEETMQKVKVLYVRNLKSDCTEELLKEKFEEYGKVERVKKIKDYGFIHFEERDHALKALDELNGEKLGESELMISLAKPPSENKKKEARRRDQQRFYGGRGFDDFWGPGPSYRSMGPQMDRGGRGQMRRPPNRGGYRGGDFDYSYDDYRGNSSGGYHGDDYYHYPGDYGGYQDEYDYGGYGGGYGGGHRGRGRGGNVPPPAVRGRIGRGRLHRPPLPPGALPPPPPGPRSTAPGPAAGPRPPPPHRGASGGPSRGARGRPTRGAGRGSRPNFPGPTAYKRKAGGDHNLGMTKKRSSSGPAGADTWGAQPIAQQPLSQTEAAAGGSYDDQWYTDSYGSQQWG